MFGYIKPFKPYMRFCEFDIYNAFYCGLCKQMGKQYGQIFRLMLSYDFTFLSILAASLNSDEPEIKMAHCIVHPIKKRPCLSACCELDYTSAAAVISIYHKICDSINDSSFMISIPYRILRMATKKGYKLAKSRYPKLADSVEEKMKQQFELEKNKCSSIDMACEPTAAIMSDMAKSIPSTKDQDKQLSGLGYHLGRFVYLADAVTDMKKDMEKGNYNPLLSTQNSEELAQININMTLSLIADYYCKLDIKKFREILDNIIYLGLKNFRLTSRKKRKGE